VTGSRQVTIARLRELGITPDTRLGQHFLVDDNLVRVAIRLAALEATDVVLEVGPGLGVLTAALATTARHVHAVELDRRLAPALDATLAGVENVTVTWGDALHVDLGALTPAPTAFVSNLPYNVATPLIAESLGGLPLVERWSVMVQREAAERLFAAPGTGAYGGVSVLLGLACERTGLHRVSRAVFAPPPNVDSALVGFRRAAAWPTLAPDWAEIVTLVHAAFAYRRKTLANALALSGVATRERAEAALETLGLDPRTRAEAVEQAAYPALLAALA
jgi:16S rRNA (adenine1518-N6/adenine1519-N6)-dimethyltransferase